MIRRYPNCIALFTLIVPLLAAAATRNAPVIVAEDWLPVPPADLALKDNPAEPGADAMLLYRSVRVDAEKAYRGGEEVTEYERIKIFTTHGAQDQSNPSIPFVKGSSKIKDLQARTIKPDGSIVNFDGQVFEKTVEKSGSYRSLEKTFTLPQVEPGCIVEYRFTRVFSPGYFHGLEWTVSDKLYTRQADFWIKPASTYLTLSFRSSNLPKGALPQRQPDGTFSMQVHDIPGVQEEPLMPPAHVLETRVEFFYRSPAVASATPEQFWNFVASTWQERIDKYNDKKHALEKVVSETVAPGDAADEKLRKLYSRAMDVHNLSFDEDKSGTERKAEKIKPNDTIEDVIKHNYGTAGEINWYFLALARTAGFPAELVLVAPRDRINFIPTGEDEGQLQTSLVWVKAGDKEYWLDPAAKFYPFGLLPWNETEAKGIRLTAKGADMITTPAQPSSDNVTRRHVELTLADDGGASGTFEIKYEGSGAALRRALLGNEDELGRKKALNEEFTARLPENSEASVTELVNWDDMAKPLVVKGTLKVPSFATVAGSRLMVPVSVFSSAYTGDFSSATRVNPIRFPQQFDEGDDAVLHAPAGFTVEAVPTLKPVKSGELFDSTLEVSHRDATLEIKRHFELTGISFPREQYATLRNLFMTVKANDAAQAVLTSRSDTKSAAAAKN